jgi:hypothetical protein
VGVAAKGAAATLAGAAATCAGAVAATAAAKPSPMMVVARQRLWKW